jgi:(2R)-3-sulfolactate dehydrogenase (NADP+)
MTTGATTETLERPDLHRLCRARLLAAGASPRTADLLVEAAFFAEDHGFSSVGVAHLLDFVAAMEDERLDGGAVPEISAAAPALLSVDARGGAFHVGFDDAFDQLVAGARADGTMVLVQRNAYAGGQLGWFTDRVARAGLMSLAAITSSPLLSPAAGVGRVFGTNPMSWSVPRASEPPITVDQASSTTAMANVRDFAARGEPLPEGWAIDAGLAPTTDAVEALDGAVLPFGGYKGGNIAWFVELFATMGGAAWSLDAPSAWDGSQSPAVGMFLLAIDPAAVDAAYPLRVQQHVDRLAGLGVRRPGIVRLADENSPITVESELLAALRV